MNFDIQGPEITIDEASIEFGLVREGSIEERWITVRNQSRIPATWSLNLEDGDLGDNELCVEPANGTLPPLKCARVKVELRALKVKSLDLLLSTRVEDGNVTYVIFFIFLIILSFYLLPGHFDAQLKFKHPKCV